MYYAYRWLRSRPYIQQYYTNTRTYTYSSYLHLDDGTVVGFAEAGRVFLSLGLKVGPTEDGLAVREDGRTVREDGRTVVGLKLCGTYEVDGFMEGPYIFPKKSDFSTSKFKMQK